MIRTYSELITIPTFEERFRYLQLAGKVGKETFGFDRILNQRFYHSPEWKRVKNTVIIRDMGCDLGLKDYEIYGPILVHHMNPITIEDIYEGSEFLMNPEFLICTAQLTHNAIHYGDENLIAKGPVERSPFDTCPWKNESVR